MPTKILIDMQSEIDEAIVLRSYPLGERDKILVVMTHRHGKLRGVVRSTQKKGSLGRPSIAESCLLRLRFKERENQPLARFEEGEILESFFESHISYDKNIAMSFMNELATEFIPEKEPSEKMFRLLVSAARALKKSASPKWVVTYFCYWLLRLSGFLSPFNKCSNCERSFSPELHCFFDRERSVSVCEDCPRRGSEKIDAVMLSIIQAFDRQPPDLIEAKKSSALERLLLLLLDQVRRHHGHPLKTEQFLKELNA